MQARGRGNSGPGASLTDHAAPIGGRENAALAGRSHSPDEATQGGAAEPGAIPVAPARVASLADQPAPTGGRQNAGEYFAWRSKADFRVESALLA